MPVRGVAPFLSRVEVEGGRFSWRVVGYRPMPPNRLRGWHWSGLLKQKRKWQRIYLVAEGRLEVARTWRPGRMRGPILREWPPHKDEDGAHASLKAPLDVLRENLVLVDDSPAWLSGFRYEPLPEPPDWAMGETGFELILEAAHGGP